jgi:biopolymer transport protein ExbD
MAPCDRITNLRQRQASRLTHFLDGHKIHLAGLVDILLVILLLVISSSPCSPHFVTYKERGETAASLTLTLDNACRKEAKFIANLLSKFGSPK